ncbi:hypothetical protein HN873_070877 [Arachis hypogaea]
MGPTEIPSQSTETIKIPTTNYEFGATFIDHPKLMLLGRILIDGRLNARVKCDVFENLTLKANAQLMNEPHMSQGMVNFDYKGIMEEFETGECETRDSCSDTLSDESECEKLWRWDGSSSEEGGMNNVEQDSHQLHFNDRLGHLYCQYFERSTPYGRVPLMDKLTEQKLTRKEGISFSCLRKLADKIEASGYYVVCNLKSSFLAVADDSGEVKTVQEDKALICEDWKENIFPLLDSAPSRLNPTFFGIKQYFAAKSLISSRGFEIDDFHGFGMTKQTFICVILTWRLSYSNGVCTVMCSRFNHKTGAEDVHFTASSNSVADDDVVDDNSNNDEVSHRHINYFFAVTTYNYASHSHSFAILNLLAHHFVALKHRGILYFGQCYYLASLHSATMWSQEISRLTFNVKLDAADAI